MNFTTVMDKSGRLVLPKSIREALSLSLPARLNLEIVGDKVQLSEAAVEPRVERRGKRRVVVGWEGFDAGKAVRDARRERAGQLEARFRK